MHDMAKPKVVSRFSEPETRRYITLHPHYTHKAYPSSVTSFDETEIWVMFDFSPASQRTANLSGDHRNSVTTSIKFQQLRFQELEKEILLIRAMKSKLSISNCLTKKMYICVLSHLKRYFLNRN